MAEEVNVATLVANFVLDASQTEQAVTRASSDLQNLGVEAEKADAIARKLMSDPSNLIKYQQQMDLIADKIELQRQKVEQLNEVAQRTYLPESAAEASAALGDETIKLEELSNQFTVATGNMDTYLRKQIATSEATATMGTASRGASSDTSR